MKHDRWARILAAATMGLAVAFGAVAAPDGAAGTPRQLRWDDLVPKGWDPMGELQKTNPGFLMDDTPQGMGAMREIWDRAPTVSTFDGTSVKLAGYVVPLEASQGAVREFLLVPYFGACIHMPPPPANQIVHVVAASPIKELRAMDVVWVNGVLRTRRAETSMGSSGYRIEAATTEPYVAKPR